MKKIASLFTAVLLTAALFAGCTPQKSGGASSTTAGGATAFDATAEIMVVSREDGSGTRGAFIELFGVEVKGEGGSKTDRTTQEAITAPKTDIMLTTVANDENGIGYVSLGSLNETVKPLAIDGAAATAENVKNGSYKIARPFMIATKGEATGLAKDFIDFILAKEGQEVVTNGYIAIVEDAAPYAGTKPAGKLVVAGSSSVSPIMEKLKEAYQKVNTGAEIQIQQSDSTAGMTGAVDGTCDIGMASRALKESELKSLTGIAIANDGIAVIVNPKNPMEAATPQQVQDIFTGGVTTWEAMK